MLLLLAQVSLGPYLGTGDSVDPERGLLVRSAATRDGARIDYERPVVVLPPALEEGETHTTLRRYVILADGERRDVGSHHFEAEVLGIDAIDGYADCLRIRRHTLRMDYGGTQVGEELTEWYARDVGLVKAVGRRYWKDASGAITDEESVDYQR